jgi:hypothetical protein
MKTPASVAAVTIAALGVLSCEKKEDPAATGSTPPASEIVEPAPPSAVPVTQPEDFKVAEEEPGVVVTPSPTPGQRLDNAIEKTEDGLETAKEKTEEGLRKAAEKTGGFLQRAGETIERKASGQ